MKKLKLFLFFLSSILFGQVYADEGMWLLQLMQEQNLLEKMKAQGLLIDGKEIYSPNGVSLKDAVGIFGNGCTGEIVSSDGLILTNHHCGYGAIQQHSSVEHDYLTDGFWAKNRGEELPTPGLAFKFIERIVDVTDSINAMIKDGKVDEVNAMSRTFLNKFAQEQLKKSDLNGKPGIIATAQPFYAGNKFYLFYIKNYTDVRMVAAPPSSIGKFGGETDNWMWPRHTGDFSLFRIYADANGEPADYSKDNVPLKVKKHFAISLNGFENGDYAMIMGFPGSTSRYLTKKEVEMRMNASNKPRIDVRTAYLNVLKEVMANSDKTRIQYASKFAGSSNYWKNSIGMNKAIIDNKVLETKAEQEQNFAKFAKENNNQEYMDVISQINNIIDEKTPINTNLTYYVEVFQNAIEFGTPCLIMDSIKVAIQQKDKEKIAKYIDQLKQSYSYIHYKDYDHEVDRKVMKALIPLYGKSVDKEYLLPLYKEVEEKWNGNFDAYIDNLYDNSIFSNEKNFNKFISKPTVKAIDNDPMTKFVRGKYLILNNLRSLATKDADKLELLHKTYVRGLCEMYHPTPKAPDANFTLRMTYGNIKPYSPKDGVAYSHYTTLKGVMEKEDPTNREFIVPEKLKELYNNKDYGRYAMKNGEMPTCFLTTNDITGGNSGSPVINGKGELIGIAFDGNWESLSGDINFDNELQRCIAVDIRYVLFIIDKLGGCKNLVDEMTIAQ